MKIEIKDNIIRYGAYTMCAVVMSATIGAAVQCRSIDHRDTLCPLTRMDLMMGFKKDALKHQYEAAYNAYREQENSGEPEFGVKKREYIDYSSFEMKKRDVEKAKLEDSQFNFPWNSYYIYVGENSDVKKVLPELCLQTIGTGILTDNNFVQLRKAMSSDFFVTGQYVDNKLDSFNLVSNVIESVCFIGPVDTTYPEVTVLEDRDGNQKGVFFRDSFLSDDQHRNLFKTFYYDEEAGYYKVDENLFVNFMRNCGPFIERDYQDPIAVTSEDGKNITYKCPEGYTMNEYGRCYKDILNFFPDFSFEYFVPCELQDEVNYIETPNVKKLVK